MFFRIWRIGFICPNYTLTHILSRKLCVNVFDRGYAALHSRDMDYKKLIRAIMEATGKNQTEVGKVLKVEQPTVSRWLKGAQPDVPQHERIISYAKKLGIIQDEGDASAIEDRPRDGIVEIDVRAGLGGGGTTEGREVRHDGNYADPVKSEAWHFPSRFMREEVRAPENRVIVIETEGDSMSPTILSGDRVIVDTGHRLPSPDGIYAIRDRYGAIVVKRLQVLRRGDPPVIRIISDNKAHDPEDVGADEIAIVGRVLWGLKRL